MFTFQSWLNCFHFNALLRLCGSNYHISETSLWAHKQHGIFSTPNFHVQSTWIKERCEITISLMLVNVAVILKFSFNQPVWQEASSIGSPSPFHTSPVAGSLLYSGLQRSLCPWMKNLPFLLWSFDTVCSFTKRTNVRFPLLCTASHSLASLHAYTPLEACYHWVG